MARRVGLLKCPGCKFDTCVNFEYPGAVGSSVFSFQCSCCSSTVQIVAKRKAGPKAFRYDAKLTHPSPQLVSMLAEERAHLESPA